MLLYVDSSVPLAIAFEEPGHDGLRTRLEQSGELFSSHLLEAEFRAALRREELAEDRSEILSWFRWVFPLRPLSAQIERILQVSYLCGADLWHLACALELEQRIGRLRFLSYDRRQLEAAERVGLETLSAKG